MHLALHTAVSNLRIIMPTSRQLWVTEYKQVLYEL